MTIGDRIKQRREELNMSQDELSKKLGYESRSTINKIEKGTRNLTQAQIKPLADALETTPCFIMGWEEATKEDLEKWEKTYNQGGKLKEEVDLIEEIQKKHGKQAAEAAILYSQLDKEDQAEIRGEMRGMLKTDKYSVKKESKNA